MSGWLPGDLVASNAHNAVTPGQCALCAWPVAVGERIARLPDGRWIHTSHTATMAAPDDDR